MKKVGILKELNVKPGDVVEWLGTLGRGKDYVEYKIWKIENGFYYPCPNDYTTTLDENDLFRIVYPKLWRDMTNAERGELLLARHEGKIIECYCDLNGWEKANPTWEDRFAYRIRPEPKKRAVNLYFGELKEGALLSKCRTDNHYITFDIIDGEPDCASVKMVKILP